MDPFEVTDVLMSKIKNVDPENASKIMGYIFIQDLSERDLQRLAFGSEALLHSAIIKAKAYLGLSSNMSSTFSAPSSPSPLLNPISRPNNISNPFSQASPRIAGNGSFVDFPRNSSPRPWAIPGLRQHNSSNSSISPKSSPFLSYDNIRSGSAVVSPFTKNGGDIGGDCSNNSGDYPDDNQLDEYLSFLDDSISKDEDFVDTRVQLGGFTEANGDTHLHRRRFSESDASFGAQDGGFIGGYRPCMYFARGFCKNGDNCKFVHSDFGADNLFEVNAPGAIVGSPGEMKDLVMQQHEEMIRIKAAQQQQHQRLAYRKYINFLLQQQNEHQRFGAAGAMTGDEFHKFGRFHSERNDFLAMGMAEKANSASRQIYLTFPADSSFKDEDVSNYFSAFGLVQDVRIPYQQKRMFGFVTFVHPETVKLILARGNPHFICDSRVLVKPYKEKGKIANRTQQLLERGAYSPTAGPSGLDSGELYNSHIGPRALYTTQEMMMRRKLEEQAELQQAIELQGRRLINLQLPDIRGDFIPPRHLRSLSVGTPISLPAHNSVQPAVIMSSDGKNQDVSEGHLNSSATAMSSTTDAAEKNIQHDVNITCLEKNDSGNEWHETSCFKEDSTIPGSNVEHVLPSNLHASPTKASRDQKEITEFPVTAEVKESTELRITVSENNSLPASSTCHKSSH